MKTKTYLFFDTETTGLPIDYNAHYSNVDNFPRLVQLSWLLYQDNEEISYSDFVIIPENFIIPEESSKIHGFTTQYCQEKGYDLKKVLNKFYTDFSLCDSLVAHNMNFDKNIIMSELARNNADKFAKKIEESNTFCTMMNSIKFCNLPGKRGLKFPKLIELYVKLFGEVFEDQHNALNDVRATAKCFFKMKELNLIKEL